MSDSSFTLVSPDHIDYGVLGLKVNLLSYLINHSKQNFLPIAICSTLTELTNVHNILTNTL